MRALVLALVLALAASAAAQPTACPECARGDAVIAQFSLESIRPLSGEIAALSLSAPVTTDQYARLLELRRRAPALARLGAIDDANLGAVASALCHATLGPCVDATLRALRCFADRCEIELPKPAPGNVVDLVALPPNCHQYSTHKRSPPIGLGFEWGNGWQRSAHPTDGHAWSFGMEARMRFTQTLGLVARVDRVAGRDVAEDANGDGIDDRSTGSITRISALAGPTFVLDNTRYESTTRFLRVDLLGGYLATRSQPDESGPAAGIDVAYQIAMFRLGVRAVQGFGDAKDASMVLAHLGIVGGGAPTYDNDLDCGAEPTARSSRLALGFDTVLGGGGFSKQLGYLATGLGVELLWHLARRFDLLTRADIEIYPRENEDRVIHQAVLGGLRIDHGRGQGKTGFFSTIGGGYTHGAGLVPTTTGSGPVVDLSVGWGGKDSEGAAYLRLHSRIGVGEENRDYRTLFLSFGFELHFDPHSWRP